MDTVAALVDAKFSYARLLIQYDYAGVVLHHPQATSVMAPPVTVPDSSDEEWGDESPTDNADYDDADYDASDVS